MSKIAFSQARFQGIADFNKESLIPDQVAWCRSVDYRTNPREITLLPKTAKESGSTVVDLPMWADTTPVSMVTYIYGNTGHFYSRTSTPTYTDLHTVPSSHGNGLAYYGEDDYMYYTNDTVIGRYGPLSSSPQFTDDFLGAQGGVPTNTYSLSLVAASSQYADRADTASLSITGNITLEAYFKPTTLPASGSSMALVSKWDESGSTRSYIMDINGVAGYFGDGSDGALTISVDTTEAPIDSACTGTTGTTSLSATNASFAASQIVLIHQTRGTNAGTWMRNTITGYTAGTITLLDPLNATYTSGAQVRVLKQYTNVTVNSGVTYSAKAWNGTVGGILAFIANGTVTITGTLSAGLLGPGGGFSTANQGFRGNTTAGGQGEGTAGAGGSVNGVANGNGGGGGSGTYAGGAGGGHANTGTAGSGTTGGTGGNASGSTDLTTLTFGGAGGTGSGTTSSSAGAGGYGGGVVFVTGVTITINNSTGFIKANGSDGQVGGDFAGGGGGGAGGAVLLKAQTATLNTNRIVAQGGSGGSSGGRGWDGGTGSDGRIHIDYLTSYTGTTTPTIDATQDGTLVTTATYQARLGISSTGANSEYLKKTINITTAMWYRLSISWVASTSTATFYLNGASIGTFTGTLTAIHDNASRFGVGMNRNGAGTTTNFWNGLLDDVRVWNTTRSAADIFDNLDVSLTGGEAGLAAYYQFNNAYTDATANANTLTASGTPTFSTDVPFPGATTRLDIDQSNAQNGNTYTTPTAISEAATDRRTFTPTKDPQTSIDVLVAAKGTGNVTLTVHDAQNRTIASKTIAAASMNTGYKEFVFSTPWRPVLGREYHFHVTSTVADTTLTTGTSADLETVSFHSYFGFLVTDTSFHPILPMLNFLAFGNERYLATWEGIIYSPNRLTFPSGWRVRCLAYWREYLAIGVMRGTNIYDHDRGRIYFWDGISVTFNFFIDVPEGAINAMLGSKGELHILAGYQGDHLVYVGGDKADKIKRLPKITLDKYVEFFPGAITMWKTLIHYGVAGNSDSTVIEKGAYSWGSTNKMYPETLSYDYPLSTGNRTGTSVKVGMLHAVGRNLLMGWQDNVSYGVDVVSPSAAPFASGTMEFLIRDDDVIWKDQLALILRGDFEALETGESIDIKYKFDRGSDWTGLDTPDATVGDEKVSTTIGAGRNREYQLAIDLYATGTTSPTVLGLSLYEDDLASEENFT